MDNIAFGQYYPGKSWIYKLDPRLKIILTIVLIVLIFLIPANTLNGLYMILGALGLYILVFLTTGIPVMKVLKGIKPVLFLLTFTVVLQLIYTTGNEKTLLYEFGLQIGLYQTLIIVGLFLVYFITRRFIPLPFLYLLLIVFLVMFCIKV